jgi:hypothetical protein
VPSGRRRSGHTRILLQLQRAPVISVSHFRGALQNVARNDNHLRRERPQITNEHQCREQRRRGGPRGRPAGTRTAGAYEGRPSNQGMAADASRNERRAQRQEVGSERSELGHERAMVMSPPLSLLASCCNDERIKLRHRRMSPSALPREPSPEWLGSVSQMCQNPTLSAVAAPRADQLPADRAIGRCRLPNRLQASEVARILVPSTQM